MRRGPVSWLCCFVRRWIHAHASAELDSSETTSRICCVFSTHLLREGGRGNLDIILRAPGICSVARCLHLKSTAILHFSSRFSTSKSGHVFYVLRGIRTHSLVSVSPEESEKIGFIGRRLQENAPYSALCLVRQPMQLVLQSWRLLKNFHLFPCEGGPRICSRRSHLISGPFPCLLASGSPVLWPGVA